MSELLSPMLRIILILVICGFIPFTAASFFMVVIPQKEREFKKSITEMGISTSRTIRDSYSISRYIIPVLFAFLIFFGFIVAFAVGGNGGGEFVDNVFLSGPFYGENNQAVMSQSFSVLAWAFAGGFLYAAYNIIRRLRALDLAPGVYYSAGIRILLASAVALIFSFFAGEESVANPNGVNELFTLKSSLPIISFLAGIFPQRILNYLIDRFREIFGNKSVTERSLGLYNIEGVSILHKERLEEIGIDNAQNLATASLTQLIAETPYDARQLLDWIGQAKLVCYVKDDIHRLRAIGIRSVFDLLKGNKDRIVLRELADAVGIDTPILEVVHGQVINDRGITALYNFQENKNSPARDIIATRAVEEDTSFEDSKIIKPRG